MDEHIVKRKITTEDFTGLIKLFDIVWPDAEYNKKEKLNFVLRSNSGYNYCATVQGKIVGSRMSIGENLYYSTTKLKSIQVCDTCTHPEYRGKRILSSLNKKLIEDFFIQGDEVIFNIGENSSRRVNEHYGWKYTQALHTLLSFPNPVSVFRALLKDRHALRRRVQWIPQNSSFSIDSLLLDERNKVMQSIDRFYVNYDIPFYKWRITSNNGMSCFKHPDFGVIFYKYGLCGNLKYVTIGEMFLYKYDNKCFKHLLKVFKAFISPDILKIAISIGHPLYKFYRKSGFIKYKVLNLGFRTNDEKLSSYCSIDSNWAISTLDFDTF